MANYSPDDQGMPEALPGPSAKVAEDGNFKRGRFNPIIILLALLAVGGSAFAVWHFYKKDQQRLLPEQRAKEMQNIFILPAEDQVPKWREWAKHDDKEMVQEALLQLAQLKDEETVDLATKALARGDASVNGVAAQVLAHIGSPKADSAKPALLKALEKATDADRPQLVWALVALGEPSVFKQAMDLYRDGILSNVQRVGGGVAFDPEKLANLVSLDELAGMAGDKSQAVRQLVATTLAKKPDAKYLDTLIQLVEDPELEVAGQAANGLAKIPDPRSRDPLLKKLAKAQGEDRNRFLEALRDGIGGEGLVLALDSVAPEPEQTKWFQTDQIFKLIEQLADPRAGDALDKWGQKPDLHPHWRSEVGMRLAEIGDVRAAKYLAERMGMDPTKVYDPGKMHQLGRGGHLSKTDDQRVWASRMLADLAIINPDKRADLLVAEEPVLAWLTGKPQPHANGLRFLANIKSELGLKKMREWAFPDAELPKEGARAQPPDEWVTAQSAMRYIGRYHDEESFDKLVKALDSKKDKKLDITQEGLMSGGKTLLGMVLRAIGVGASEGLAEYGDPKPVKRLMEFIEDDTWHEEARLAACSAVAWTGTPEDMKEVAKRAIQFGKDTKASKIFIGGCYATALALRPVPEAQSDLADLLTPDMPIPVRNAVAQAIGSAPLEKGVREKLFEKMKNDETRNSAALALILGGDTSTAAQTVAMFGDKSAEALQDLKDSYFRAFGFWSDIDAKDGNLYRWVENAEAIARVKIFDGPQMWAIERLQAQFENLSWDNGPHSETRVVLRQRIMKDAKTGDDKRKEQAIRTLRFMKEQGVLMALSDEKGLTGDLAKKAWHELKNPTPIKGENLNELQAEQQAKMKK
ncbi:MAG: HEAT repeat domain-containing protein [Polyangiaceae bacterium]|nr:HEAT repeat domain-containing protein [Polyangiaceae bacterium]